MYRLDTILAWIDARPGKGKRTKAEHPPLPEVSVKADPDELLDTSQVASLLRYSNMKSFSSTRSQRLIPESPEPDERIRGHGGKTQWKRRVTVKATQTREALEHEQVHPTPPNLKTSR